LHHFAKIHFTKYSVEPGSQKQGLQVKSKERHFARIHFMKYSVEPGSQQQGLQKKSKVL
jgi:hypothetical protein